jgi:hypothetical protein
MIAFYDEFPLMVGSQGSIKSLDISEYVLAPFCVK